MQIYLFSNQLCENVCICLIMYIVLYICEIPCYQFHNIDVTCQLEEIFKEDMFAYCQVLLLFLVLSLHQHTPIILEFSFLDEESTICTCIQDAWLKSTYDILSLFFKLFKYFTFKSNQIKYGQAKFKDCLKCLSIPDILILELMYGIK